MNNIPTLTAQIVSAFVSSHQHVDRSELPAIINDIGTALAALSPRIEVGMKGFTTQDLIEFQSISELRTPVAAPTSSIDPKKSVFSSHIICLECGAKHTMLKRHLMTAHGLIPDAYREKWHLTTDYPMVAPDYAAVRSRLAKESGLGRRKVPARGGRKNGGRHV